MDERLTVTIEVADGWPTPNHMRSAAAALDTLSPARYGDILRAVADAEDARFAAHGPAYVVRRRIARGDA